MIGIIPEKNKTYEVVGDTKSKSLIEGRLYYDLKDGRIYLYSTTETRSSPKTGWFPIWNGSKYYTTKHSKKYYYPDDVIKNDLQSLSNSINNDKASEIQYNLRRSEDSDSLTPVISDRDNMFTQCVKGTILNEGLTMVDLIDNAAPLMNSKRVESFYSALGKIEFMRTNKWNVWIDTLLRVKYVIKVYKDDKVILTYEYPKDKFDTGVVKYNDITSIKDMDTLKKIIKVIMVMENITKASLRSDQIDDYAINNMMTTLNGDKVLSAQLFDRFINMANLSYSITIYTMDDKEVFEYRSN